LVKATCQQKPLNSYSINMFPKGAIPKYLGKTDVVKNNADNDDIRSALETAIPQSKEQTKGIAKSFQGKNEKETARKIYDYLMSLNYKADGSDQNIKLPSALMRTRVADCKSYSLFTAGVLSNLGIPYSLAYASYNDNPVPSHVYIITKSGIKIDAVWGKSPECKGKDCFNTDKKPKYLYLQTMNVNYLSGVSTGMGGTIVGDFFRNTAAAVKENAAVVGLSIPRQIMLGVFSLNIDGIASKVQNDMGRLEKSWLKMGGDKAALYRAVKDGASRPAKKVGVFDKLRSTIESLVAKKGVKITGYANGGMCGTPAGDAAIKLLTDGGTTSVAYQTALGAIGSTIGATIGSAIPAIGTAAGGAAGIGIGKILYDMTPTFVDALFGTASSSPAAGGVAPAPAPTTAPSPNTTTKKPFPTALVVGGAAAIAAIYFLQKRKK